MLTVSLLLCALVALSRANDIEVVEANHTCPDGWTYFGQHCLEYVEDEMTWAEAERNCQKHNGNLASVQNQLELEFIHTLVPENSTAKGMWMGASDCQQEGTWLWSDGNVFQFTFWCPMKPNNWNGNQNCLQANVGDCNCWNDLECAEKLPSVCRTGEEVVQSDQPGTDQQQL